METNAPATPPTEEELLGTLRKLLGEDRSFRDFQKETISKIMEGRDVFTLIPTGGGKSACYQVPAMHLPGITLVISPLLALMKDQAMHLKKAEKNFGGRSIAAVLSSQFIVDYEEKPHYPKVIGIENEGNDETECDKDPDENAEGTNGKKPERSYGKVKKDLFRDLIKGKYKLFYVTPERLRSPAFVRFAKRANISMIAVDEAHCVSLWGYEFRPRYLELPKFLHLIGQRPIIAAFTATATQSIREDIQERLAMTDPFLCDSASRGRTNLTFSINRMPTSEKLSGLYEALKDRKGQRGFVYCATVRTVQEVYKYLKQQHISALPYYADLSEAEKEKNMTAFMKKSRKDAPAKVMVSTNALGMGIDIQDIRFVIHYQMPLCLENYYQEAGRAGRDGEKADCILFYSEGDLETCNELIDISLKESELWGKDIDSRRKVAKNRLNRMQKYALLDGNDDCEEGIGFLQEYILKYFKEFDPCGESSQPPLQMLNEISQINVLYANRTLVAQRLRKGIMEGSDLRVGRYQAKRKNRDEQENRPNQKPLLVSYKAEVKPVEKAANKDVKKEEENLLTYFDLMVADAVYTLMFHRVPRIYAKNIIGLLSGNKNLQSSPKRTEKVEQSIEKMMRTTIKIERSNPNDYPYEDQRGKPAYGQFLPLEKTEKGYRYKMDILPPLYEYAEIFHGQFFSIPTRRLRIKTYDDQMVFLLDQKKEMETAEQDLSRFDKKEIRHIIDFEKKIVPGVRSTDTLQITYRTDEGILIILPKKDDDTQKKLFKWKQLPLKPAKDACNRVQPVFSKTEKLTENRDDTVWQEELLQFLRTLICTGTVTGLNQIALRFRSVDSPITRSLESFLEQNDLQIHRSKMQTYSEDMTASEETLKMAHYLYCRVNMMRSPHSPKSAPSGTRRKILFDTMINDLNIVRAKEDEKENKKNHVIDKQKVLWMKMLVILEHFRRTKAIQKFDADYKNRWVTIN